MAKRRNTSTQFPSDHNPDCPPEYLKKLSGDLRARYSYGEYPNGEPKQFWYSCDSDGNFISRLTPKGKTDPPPPDRTNSPTNNRNAVKTELNSDMTFVKGSDLLVITNTLRTLVALSEQQNIRLNHMSADIEKITIWIRDYIVAPTDAEYLEKMNNKDAV